jgi:Spy/CpxP family protein refolding chaperone
VHKTKGDDMMKKSSIITLVAVIVILILGISTFVEAHGGRPGMMGYGRNGAGFRQSGYQRYQANPLDLSEDQSQVLNEIREKFFQERNQVESELHDLYTELRETVYSDTTEEQLATIKNEVIVLQERLLNLQIEYWQNVKNLLTPDQLDKIKQLEQNTGFRGGRMLGRRPVSACPFYPSGF